MKLVIASHNQGKLKEFKSILKNLNIEVLTALDMGLNLDDFEEVGTTYEENAYLKAKYVYEQTGETSIADDSGIFINALPDILGVYSARFMGSDTDYSIKNKRLLEMLENSEDRTAVFTSAISLVGKELNEMFVAEVKGTIASSIDGHEGFGYDPIFIPNGYTESYASMSQDTKNEMSHRGLALRKFLEFMEGYEHDS